MKTPRAGIRDTTPDEKRDAMRGAAGSIAASGGPLDLCNDRQ